MARKAYERARRAASRPQIIDAASANFLALETKRPEQTNQNVNAAGIVGGDGAPRNQLLRKFDDIDGHGSLSDTIERAS